MWPFGRPPIFITDPRKYAIRTMRLRVLAKKPHSYCPSVEKKSFSLSQSLSSLSSAHSAKRPEATKLRGLKLWSFVANTNPWPKWDSPTASWSASLHHSTNFWSEPDMFAESRHMKGRIHDTVQARVNQANYSRCSKQFFRLSSCASRIQILHALVAIASEGVCTK